MGDAINPAHYRGLFASRANETIAVTRHLCFCMGNYYKYLARLYKKDNPKQDFNKARWYMEDWLAHHSPVDPVITKSVTLFVCKEPDVMPILNPFAEKARIAFGFIEPPIASESPELYDRYKLLEIVTQDYIIPEWWRQKMDAYENKYLKEQTP